MSFPPWDTNNFVFRVYRAYNLRPLIAAKLAKLAKLANDQRNNAEKPDWVTDDLATPS